MAELALGRNYELQLPVSFVDVDNEEMEYLEGGGALAWACFASGAVAGATLGVLTGAIAGLAFGAAVGTITLPIVGTVTLGVTAGVVGAVCGAFGGAMSGGWAGYNFGRLVETKILGWD